MQQLKVFSIGNDFWTSEKSRLNVDTLAAALAVKFNMKDISCSDISNILLENDTLTKNIHSIFILTQNNLKNVSIISVFLFELIKCFIYLRCTFFLNFVVLLFIVKKMVTLLLNVSTIVNFVKCNASSSRLFHIVCKEIGSEHESLLYHIEVS